MPQLIIQPSINDARGKALLELIGRLGSLDLSPLLVYRLDSTPDDALMLLAWQFDILGPEWQLGAPTGESVDNLRDIDLLTNVDSLTSIGGAAGLSDFDSLRDLLRAAIPLHRTRGTPYAIKTALAALGWTAVTIQEGQSVWGGNSYPASQGWAVFRVIIDLEPDQGVGDMDPARVTSAINFFKPVRCLLDSLWFNLAPIADMVSIPGDIVISIFRQSDSAPPASDLISANAWAVADLKVIAPLYDGHFYHTGIAYGLPQPTVADSGVVVLGSPVAAGA
jgi:P2-related tail formation protein